MKLEGVHWETGTVSAGLTIAPWIFQEWIAEVGIKGQGDSYDRNISNSFIVRFFFIYGKHADRPLGVWNMGLNGTARVR